MAAIARHRARRSWSWSFRKIIVKVREVIRRLEREGWRVVRQRGSHRQLKHPFRKGVVTIAGPEGADLPIGTLKSIFRQAGIRP
jgi:predicted RNA binding protein YcfA (HicA-like mRNA interferase family)